MREELNESKSRLNNKTIIEIKDAISKNNLERAERLIENSDELSVSLPSFINIKTAGYSLAILILSITGILTIRKFVVKIRREKLIKKAKSIEKELVKQEDKGVEEQNTWEKHERGHEALKDEDHDEAEDIFKELEEELDA